MKKWVILFFSVFFLSSCLSEIIVNDPDPSAANTPENTTSQENLANKCNDTSYDGEILLPLIFSNEEGVYKWAKNDELINISEGLYPRRILDYSNSLGLMLIEDDNNFLYFVDTNMYKIEKIHESPILIASAEISVFGDIVYQGYDNQIHLIDIVSGSIIDITNSNDEHIFPIWNPSGTHIFYISNSESGSKIIQFEIETAISKTVFTTDLFIIISRISPNGDVLAFSLMDQSYENHAIYTKNLISNEIINLTGNYSVSPEYFSWSNYNNKLLLTSNENLVDLYSINADGSDLTPLVQGFESIYFMRWSPDDSYILFQGRTNTNDPGNLEIYLLHYPDCDQVKITDFDLSRVGFYWALDQDQ